MANLNIKFNNKTYSIDSAALADAMASLEGHLISMTNGGSEPYVAGLYQTGAVALYEEQGAGAIEGMLTTSWDDLLANEIIAVNEGVVSCKNAITGDLFLLNDGSITGIGDSAFYNRYGLTGVVIPEGVTSIGNNALYCCKQLTNIIIPEGVTNIGSTAFSDCVKLKSIVIPHGVTSLNESVLSYCYELISVVIPESVTSIGKYAFSQSSRLPNLTLPSSITYIDNWAFWGCSKLTDVSFNGTIAQWNAITKEQYWNNSFPATHVHCTDGDVAL